MSVTALWPLRLSLFGHNAVGLFPKFHESMDDMDDGGLFGTFKRVSPSPGRTACAPAEDLIILDRLLVNLM